MILKFFIKVLCFNFDVLIKVFYKFMLWDLKWNINFNIYLVLEVRDSYYFYIY